MAFLTSTFVNTAVRIDSKSLRGGARKQTMGLRERLICTSASPDATTTASGE
jgi:hypothetical protein